MKASLCILVLGLLALSSMASARKLSAAREATLSGNCLPNNTLIDSLATTATTSGTADAFVNGFVTMRNEFVNYNMKKSLYRDGDVLAVYTLTDKAKSLAGCATACLLDWRVDSTTLQTIKTTIIASSDISPFRECEYFNFNIDTGECTLLSGQSSVQLSKSGKYWSGYVSCSDLTTIDDWATQVVA